jgi:hypothetical protein
MGSGRPRERLHLMVVSTTCRIRSCASDAGNGRSRARVPSGRPVRAVPRLHARQRRHAGSAVELAVEGAERPRVALVVDDDQVKRETVTTWGAVARRAPARSGLHDTFRSRDGKPVTDPSRSRRHGSPGDDQRTARRRAATRWAVPRWTEHRVQHAPDRTGFYKAWGQFQRRGRVTTVPFVVRSRPTAEGQRAARAAAPR